jgi:hypothetical protein
MRTIASIAIKALTDLENKLLSHDWYDSYGALCYAWREIRKYNNYDTMGNNEWRDKCVNLIRDLKDGYMHGDKLRKRERATFTETMNIRVTIFVMGGLEDAPQWEADCNIFLAP